MNKFKNNSVNHLKAAGDSKITMCGIRIDTFTTAFTKEIFNNKICKCKKCEKSLPK